MKYNAPSTRSKDHLLQQVKCISLYAIGATAMLWLLSLLPVYNTILFHSGLLFFGWISWTFLEYIAHRFWLHGPGSRDLLKHAWHHAHPTEIEVTARQRLFIALSAVAVLYIAYRLKNYFTLFSGFYIGMVGYFFMHVLIHKKWFGKYFPRLQQFHILHHLKLPNHCFGVSVYLWDFIFNTMPPKKEMPTDRVVQFYFHGKKSLLRLLLLPLLLSSCTHYYYAPNTANIPMLREKGEGRINVNYYGTDEATGGELQAAYATGKRTAFMLNILTASSNGELFNSDKYNPRNEALGFGTYGEVGYGFFSTVPKSKCVFEAYAGIGTGRITNWYAENAKSKVRLIKMFVQPSLAWRSKNFEVAFSSRFAFANLKVKENTGDLNQEVEYIRSHGSALLAEPSLLIRFGLKRVQIAVNYSQSANLSNNWQQETTGIGVGLSFPFKIEQ
jgi:hypothetical protein